MYIKTAGQILLIYFACLWVYLIWGWVNIFNIQYGEMADGIFTIMWFLASLYIIIITIWTYRLFRKGRDDQSARTQYTLIFIFGVAIPLFCIYNVYN